MKHILFFITIILILQSCNTSTTSYLEEQPTSNSLRASVKNINPAKTGDLLTLADAEKIMGQKSKLMDSATSIKKHFSIYNCGYTALETDKKTGKTGKLYMAYWLYDNEDSAHNAYTFIKDGNEKNGIKVLHGLGDEAYFHTDNTNFYFIIVRKGEKVFDMKVNKTTSTTSVDEFNAVAEKITAML